ncbi:hypothetical protein T08_3000 [Trichinella sp. T8]|nr:hypothetical protein T08_3000 [Trichinella sp. T8]
MECVIRRLSLHVFTVPKVEISLDKACDSTGLSCFVSRSEAKMSRIAGIHAFANTLNTVYCVVPDNKSFDCVSSCALLCLFHLTGIKVKRKRRSVANCERGGIMSAEICFMATLSTLRLRESDDSTV